jgi:sigma-E factor negative regulatory protein RseC
MTNATTTDHTVEGIARVVAIDGGRAWLEPEQTSSCGSCASAAHCGSSGNSSAPGLGTVASRIQARRFPLDNSPRLHIGERVVIGVGDRALLRASLVAYALPLLFSLTAGCLAQSAWASDAMTMASMAAGLGFGLAAARLGALWLGARGDLAPRFLRRAGPHETCNTH